MSAALLYNERDMAKAVIAQNTESPAEGWRSLYNDFTAARDEILQPAMDALSKGMKQGVDILPLGEDGRGIRVSNNAPWYQEYYKQHGKAPNQAQLRDLAYLLTVGDASAPNVEGWIPTTREAAEAMDAARGELDELNGHIKTLENIKERMMKVDSFEVKGSAGLSPEGYKLYRQIIEMLEKIGGKQKEDKQTKVARMNAMLFAHHADIFAAAMRTQEGKEKYTALDYFKDRFALRYGGTDMRQNGLYQSAMYRNPATSFVEFMDNVISGRSGKSYYEKIVDGVRFRVTSDEVIHVQRGASKHPLKPEEWEEFLQNLEHIQEAFPVRDSNMPRGKAYGIKITAPHKTYGAVIEFADNGVVYLRTVAHTTERNLDEWLGRTRQDEKTEEAGVRRYTGVPSRTVNADDNHAISTGQSPVSLSMIQERLGIVNEKETFNQSAWHGSPHDFVEFLLSAIGTGEGAQAHGWGLYFAKAKKTAASYRGRLSSKNELEIVYDGKKSEELTGDIKAAIQLLHLQGFRPEDNLGKFIKTRVKDYTEMIRRWENRIREIDNTLSTNAAQAAQAQLYEERKDNVDRVAASKNVVRQLKLIDPKKAVIKGAGSLFHVEIPDNDVLLDEDKSYTKQPLKVREALEKLVRGLTLDQLENWNDVRRLGKSKVIAEIMDALSESNGMNIYGTISDLAEGQKEASVLLNKYGIKGITYGGQEDGRCFVVFDDKAISIIEKFNQMLRQEVRGEISKEDGKRIITLFESADESTFMHEMGHMFLMDLDELAKMDEASAKELETVNAWAEWHEGAAEEYKDTDFADEFRYHENAILAAKKAGDVVAEKAALERWQQERFARGFEMYLSEGKAPSAAMRSVFRRFKAFLRKIYNLAKNAGAMPSVEVQAVMARMIATENEIAEAKLDERFRPIEKLLGKESVESLLGETEAELYQRWTQEAQEEAEDILRKRVMNDLKKEAREEFNEKVEAERERKRAELENDPVYLAEYAMRQGGSTDVVMNWFPSYAAYKKARGKRKTLENELKDYMTEYASKLDEQIMQAHLSDENVARAMQTPKAYHRRLAIESAALRRKERLMRLLGGNAPEEVKKKAVAEVKKAESPTRRGTKQKVRKDIRRLHQMHGYP